MSYIEKDSVILITGANGFLGSNVHRKFIEQGYKNIVTPTSKDYDLRSQTETLHLFNQYNPDVVVHVAAKIGGIGSNRRYPGEFFYDNAIMNLNVVHQSYLSGVKKFVGVGTVCSYPKITPTPFKEEDLWNGYPEETNAPYGLAKKMMLVHTQAYHEQYNFKGIHLVLVNLYGPGDNFDLQSSHVIPALIRKCSIARELNLEKISVWGTGTASREFIYVGDAAEAIYLATEKYEKHYPVNIGSGVQIKIKELVELIMELTGYHGRIEWDKTKPDGQPIRMLDTSKAKNYFDFEARTDFRNGLKSTINYYNREFLDEDLNNDNILKLFNN